MSLTSPLSQPDRDPRVKLSLLGRLDKPWTRRFLLLLELKLVVKLFLTPELLLDEELFFEMDDITRLTLVGLDPSFEQLPDHQL